MFGIENRRLRLFIRYLFERIRGKRIDSKNRQSLIGMVIANL